MTTAFRFIDGFSKLTPIAVFATFALISIYCLNRSLVGIPIGTAYAVWTGIGAAGTVLVGATMFDEPTTAPRLVFLTLLVGSIVGLRLVSTS